MQWPFSSASPGGPWSCLSWDRLARVARLLPEGAERLSRWRVAAGSSLLGRVSGAGTPSARAECRSPHLPQRRAAAGRPPVSLHRVWNAALHRREGTALSALRRQAAPRPVTHRPPSVSPPASSRSAETGPVRLPARLVPGSPPAASCRASLPPASRLLLLPPRPTLPGRSRTLLLCNPLRWRPLRLAIRAAPLSPCLLLQMGPLPAWTPLLPAPHCFLAPGSFLLGGGVVCVTVCVFLSLCVHAWGCLCVCVCVWVAGAARLGGGTSNGISGPTCLSSVPAVYGAQDGWDGRGCTPGNGGRSGPLTWEHEGPEVSVEG